MRHCGRNGDRIRLKELVLSKETLLPRAGRWLGERMAVTRCEVRKLIVP